MTLSCFAGDVGKLASRVRAVRALANPLVPIDTRIVPDRWVAAN